MPAVTVLLLSYNQADYLRQCIQSVVDQTCDDWELLLTDNGSTDGSAEIIKDYAAHPRVRAVLHGANRPVTQRQNEAVALARGEYFSILYSDDFYLPNKLERQLGCFHKDPAIDVVYSPGYRLNQTTGRRWLDPTIDVSGSVFDAFLDNLMNTAYVNPISPLARTACFKRYPFLEEIFIEGEAIYLRMAMTYRFHFDPEPVVVMRDHPFNRGRAVRRSMENFLVALDRLEHHPDFPEDSHARLQALKVRTLRSCGWQGVRVTDELQWAREMFRQAVALDWMQAFHPKTVAGVGMSLLPSAARRTLNHALFAMTRPSGHSNAIGVSEIPRVRS